MNYIWQNVASQRFKTGLYDGGVSVRDVKKHGTVGVGEFDRLDGEIVGWNGQFYRVTADGKVSLTQDSDLLCFAMVSHFTPQHIVNSTKECTRSELEGRLENEMRLIVGENWDSKFYAYSLQGKFSSVVASAMPAQKKPFVPFSESLQSAKKFSFQNTNGIMIGFYNPPYMADIGIAGHHFHFLKYDLSGGGHVETFSFSNGIIEMEVIEQYLLSLKVTSQ